MVGLGQAQVHRGNHGRQVARRQRLTVTAGSSKLFEKSKAGGRQTCAQQGFLLLCKNEANMQPALSVPLQDGLKAGLIRLGFQGREGGLSRKEIIGLGSRFLKRQGSSVMEVCYSPFHQVPLNLAHLDHLLCFMPGPVK